MPSPKPDRSTRRPRRKPPPKARLTCSRARPLITYPRLPHSRPPHPKRSRRPPTRAPSSPASAPGSPSSARRRRPPILWRSKTSTTARDDALWMTDMGFSATALAAIDEMLRADDWGLSSAAFELPPAGDAAEIARRRRRQRDQARPRHPEICALRAAAAGPIPPSSTSCSASRRLCAIRRRC